MLLREKSPWRMSIHFTERCGEYNGPLRIMEMSLYSNLTKGKRCRGLGNMTKKDRTYNPVGDTDSEKIFCSILNALKSEFSTLPSLPLLHDYLKEILDELVSHDKEGTILNFILGCGEHTLFAYSWPGSRPGSNVWNGLHYVVREPPFRQAALVDCDYEVDFSELAGEKDRVAVIATKPLTLNEEWVEFGRNELILFDEGKPLLASEDRMDAELAGHGLDSSVLDSAPLLKEDLRRHTVSKRSIFSGADI
mmetsp:Transcript_15370/g.19495  ORF Transcript_15370/g.19495 Transcript_15370/m.19495 type:complete len:250 (+) Transcript_15370:351-1100(+)